MSPKLLIALALVAACASPALAQSRQQTVRERSTHVMPFSMDATMHQFEPTKTGGLMIVTVHDADPQQVALVRAHLRKEATAFARGNYADPAYIHGNNMPGLASLSAGAKRISVKYTQLSDGGSIAFRTSDARLIAAIHRWFAAQVSDHGHDAMM